MKQELALVPLDEAVLQRRKKVRDLLLPGLKERESRLRENVELDSYASCVTLNGSEMPDAYTVIYRDYSQPTQFKSGGLVKITDAEILDGSYKQTFAKRLDAAIADAGLLSG